MNNDTKVTLLKKLDVTDMAGDKVMIDFETGKYFLLQGTASDIWDMIQQDITIGEIKNRLQELYDVDDSTCMEGIHTFLDQLQKNNFIHLS